MRYQKNISVAIAICGIVAICVQNASSRQNDSFVRLQPSSSGNPQAGHLSITGTARVGGFRLGTSATAGYVLTTNALGVGTWAPMTGVSLPFDQSAASTSAVFKITNTDLTGSAIFGFAAGSGAGVYGRNNNGNAGTLGNSLLGVEGVNGNGNFGRLGTIDFGVQGLNATGGNEGRLGTINYGVWGSVGGNTISIYGINQTSNNYGYFGSIAYGAYGYYDMSGNYGYLGSDNFGVFGKHSASGNAGALGTQDTGVFGSSPMAGGHGVSGIHVNSNNQGYIGSSQYGVYGYHSSSMNYGALGASSAGVYANGASGYGVQAISGSPTLSAVSGQNSSGGPGVLGVATTGVGVSGTSTSANGVFGSSTSSNGVMGISASSASSGVYGDNSAGGYGVAGRATAAGSGVYAFHTNGNYAKLAVTDFGLIAEHLSTGNKGWIGGIDFGIKGAVSGTSNAVYGINATSQNYGWLGGALAAVYGNGVGGHGVMGVTALSNYSGVIGQNSAGGPGVNGTSNTGPGVLGSSMTGPGLSGSSNGTNGVQGYTSSSGSSGVYGENSSTGYGVAGRSTGTGTGVLGVNTNASGYAGYFSGRVYVDGNITAATKNFKIDHPLDPLNKYLQHSCIESDVRMNIYKGRVTTDGKGYAWVQLPSYFEALNKNIEYHLTVIGQFAQAIVGEEVQGNRFLIRTDKPNVKVSWQVLGERQDAYARAHPLIVEEEKLGDERGKYLHPVEHGAPPEMGINFQLLGAPEIPRQPNRHP